MGGRHFIDIVKGRRRLLGVRGPVSARRTHLWAVTVGLAFLASAGLGFPASHATPPTATTGTAVLGGGIFSFAGTANFTMDLMDSGNYYLAAASDGGLVDVRVEQNGTLLAETNTTTNRADPVALPEGNYSMHATGNGRAALGIEFATPAGQDFPVNERIVGFVSAPPTLMVVHLRIGNASLVLLGVYGDALRLVLNETSSTGGDFQVTFGGPEAFAFFVISSTATHGGIFSVSWSAAPPADLTLLYLASVVVPVAIAAAILLFFRRRRRRRAT